MLKNSPLSILTSILIAGLLIGGSIYAGLNYSSNATSTDAGEKVIDPNDLAEYDPLLIPSPLPTGPVDLKTEDQPYLGRDDASVEVVEFVDFQCPYCKEFAQNILTTMKKDYIETGKVKFVTKDFPLPGHLNAESASLAANCIYQQGGNSVYFQYHDLLFEKQSEWAEEEDPRASYISYAQQMNLDTGKFEKCYDKNDYQEDMEADIEEGRSYGVNGTPIFFVNGKVHVGLPPTFEDMREILEEAYVKI